MQKNQKGFAPIVIVLMLLVLAGAGGTCYYLMNKQTPKQIACTAEAKLCPDGSSVGRTGPNCEFAACPEVKIDETANWKTYANKELGIEFKYPPAPSGCENYCSVNTNNNSFRVGTTEFIVKNSGGLALSAFVDKYVKDFTVISREDKTIGGQNGILINYRFGGMGGLGEVAFLEKGSNVFVFNFTAGAFCCNQSDRIYEDDVFNAILSTFKLEITN